MCKSMDLCSLASKVTIPPSYSGFFSLLALLGVLASCPLPQSNSSLCGEGSRPHFRPSQLSIILANECYYFVYFLDVPKYLGFCPHKLQILKEKKNTIQTNKQTTTPITDANKNNENLEFSTMYLCCLPCWAYYMLCCPRLPTHMKCLVHAKKNSPTQV